jgi:Flp pilus assembly protein TadD
MRYGTLSKLNMTDQERYDDAMFDFSSGRFEEAVRKLEALLHEQPENFDAQLALGMAFYRLGNFEKAILEGRKAETLRPHEQLVHTNLSLFYMKAGDKQTAEHHGLQARIASWKTPAADAAQASPSDPELELAKPKPPVPVKVPDMPWKKKPRAGTAQ